MAHRPKCSRQNYKTFRKKMEENLYVIFYFLYDTKKHKENIDKLDFIKVKNFCSSKTPLRELKAGYPAGRKY